LSRRPGVMARSIGFMRGLAAERPKVDVTTADSDPAAPVRLPVENRRLLDAELVQRATEGDPWAEEALYRRYAELVIGTAKRLLGNPDEAMDVAQDSFMTAFEKLSTLRDASTFKTWLMQITVRNVHRRFRRRRLLKWLGLDESDEGALESLASPDVPLEVRADLSMLGVVLSGLPPALRLPWMLRHVEGHELTEVAALCNCSLATAKRRIVAADSRVARRLGATGAT
jgi:RNA polymerase sigma-70 factor, ECF subfamily